MSKYRICPECNGEGGHISIGMYNGKETDFSEICEKCEGSGKVLESNYFQVSKAYLNNQFKIHSTNEIFKEITVDIEIDELTMIIRKKQFNPIGREYSTNIQRVKTPRVIITTPFLEVGEYELDEDLSDDESIVIKLIK